jgi:hypothetical protein
VLRLGTLAVALGLAACSGEIGGELFEGLTPEEQVAIEKWVDKALPAFSKGTCLTCHDGSMPAVGYIAGEDDIKKRDSLIAYVPRIVNLGAPASSRVLTKGAHTGPSLDAPLASDILSWIVAEREAHKGELMELRTTQMVAMLCTSGSPPDPGCPLNTLDMGSMGTPATFEFAVATIGADSYYTNLKIKAGAMGLYIEHPLLETWPAGATMPKPDPIDRFFAVQLNLAPNAEAILGGGEATIAGFNPADAMSVRFDVFEPQRAP